MDDAESTNLLLNPAFRYGVAGSSTVILLAVGFLFLDGTIRYVVIGMAVLEILVVPMILKRVGEEAESEGADPGTGF